MNEFFTWETLITFSGAAVATGVFTQFLKDIFRKIPTQIVSYFVAMIILALSTLALNQGDIAWQTIVMIPLNAVVVSTASNGAFEAVKRVREQ